MENAFVERIGRNPRHRGLLHVDENTEATICLHPCCERFDDDIEAGDRKASPDHDEQVWLAVEVRLRDERSARLKQTRERAYQYLNNPTNRIAGR